MPALWNDYLKMKYSSKKKSYGITYQGGKGSHVDIIARFFPDADNFYDLFGGGFSVTDYMLTHRSKSYKAFHFNEIRAGACELYQDAIAGKFSYETFKPEWISREDFHKKRESDFYIKIIWSFGSNGRDYLFSKEIEEYKKSMHQFVVFGIFDETSTGVTGFSEWPLSLNRIKKRRLFIRLKIDNFRKTEIPDFLLKYLNKKQPELLQRPQPLRRPQPLQQLRQLQQLERLEQLQRLERLERLQQLEFTSLDYRQVKIKPNSVIYCDIPYRGTGVYKGVENFDHNAFYEWASNQSEPVFISEYDLPDDRFFLLLKKSAVVKMSPQGCTSTVEKLYGNKAAYEVIQSFRQGSNG